jgi:hypothetical protein
MMASCRRGGEGGGGELKEDYRRFRQAPSTLLNMNPSLQKLSGHSNACALHEHVVHWFRATETLSSNCTGGDGEGNAGHVVVNSRGKSPALGPPSSSQDTSFVSPGKCETKVLREGPRCNTCTPPSPPPPHTTGTSETLQLSESGGGRHAL